MSNANIGWLFNKDYFKDIDYNDIKNKKNEEDIKKKVENIISQTPKIEDLKDEDILGNTHFEAMTTYPGLILGSGNAHELPSIEGQAILGFHFDYTSGLPIISGSSIKGVFRSAFKHKEYIQELVKDETLDVQKLEDEIFTNNDIFFDATIIKADSFRKVFGDDYLAPHSEDGLKNPIPLRFIKVLPNVSFRFDFELSDGILTKEQKSKLFQNILKDLGLGAKTNVGYGKFDNIKIKLTKKEEEELENEKIRKRQQQEEELQREKEAKVQAELEKKAMREAEQRAKEDEEKAKKEAFVSQGIGAILDGCEKFNKLENNIKKYIQTKSLDDNEKEILENHILNNMNDKITRKKFPFGILGNDKCLGKEKANEIADKLNLN